MLCYEQIFYTAYIKLFLENYTAKQLFVSFNHNRAGDETRLFRINRVFLKVIFNIPFRINAVTYSCVQFRKKTRKIFV